MGQIFITCFHVSLAFSGLIVRAFFDHLSGEGTLTLWVIIALQAGNTFLEMFGLGMANYVGGYLYYHARRALLFKNLLGRILQLPGGQALTQRENIASGEAVNIFRDDVAQTDAFMLTLGDVLSLSVGACIAFWVMVEVSIWVTLGTFTPLIVTLLLTHWLSQNIERYRQITRKTTGQVAGMIGEMFDAVQTIQVNQAEERIIAHFRSLNEQRRQAMLKDQLLSRLVDALADNTTTIGIGLLLIFAAREMQAGHFSIGDFALFVAYIWPVMDLLRSLGYLIVDYKQSGVSISRLQSLMQGAPPQDLTASGPVYLIGDLPSLPSTPKTDEDHLSLLNVQGLQYGYPVLINQHGSDSARQFSLENIDLRLARGSFTVITGRIGSGKSTLLRVLLGLLPLDQGDIYWNDDLVTDPGTFFVPPRVAYTPQTPRLFSDTLRNNILLGWPAHSSGLTEAIDQAVLTEDLATMPAGLDTLIGPRGVRLSGGQAQRTAAARMFVRQPELMVFDDLSSALDIETEQQLWDKLLAPSTGLLAQDQVTCLAVSHRQAALRRADQIIVLQAGQIVDVGRLDELLQRCGEMQRIWAGGSAVGKGD